MENEKNINFFIKENKMLKEENAKLKNLVEHYINSRKTYYEKNKEIVNEKATARLKKLTEEDPEKIKEYRRKAYLNQKEKKKQKENSTHI